MKTIYSQALIRKTDTSEEKITVTVQELPNFGGYHLSYGGVKTDWRQALTASPIVGQIEGSPYSTPEIAIGFAHELIEQQKKMGFRANEEEQEWKPLKS
jgi:hypothetical protein